MATAPSSLADLSNHLTVRNTFLEAVPEPESGSDWTEVHSDWAATDPGPTRRTHMQSFSVTDCTESECDDPSLTSAHHKMDVRVAVNGAREMDPSIVEQASLAAIRNMPWSITLADPNLADCPLIGCSDGFEIVTGYRRQEIIGQNCRFLNRNAGLDPALRAHLREAVRMGREFIGIIPNIAKNGERFDNLLHLSSLEVRGRKYIIGIQAALKNVAVNLNSPGHMEALRATVDCIFQGNIDAWVQMQAREFSMRLPAPYSQLLKLCSPCAFERERDFYVRLGNSGAAADEIPRITREPDVLDSDPVGPKSIGSVGHPHTCTECHFHMFNAGGCRVGKNCTYCHEVHPRANAKKNRRFMKRIMNNGFIHPDLLNASSASKSIAPEVRPQTSVVYPPTLGKGAYHAPPPGTFVTAPPRAVIDSSNSGNSGSNQTDLSREEVRHGVPGRTEDAPTLQRQDLMTSPHTDTRAVAESSVVESIGSKGHPNNCSECHFHMFNPGGCRAGKDCNFCHELHPRSNPKKNRKFMRRVAGNGFADIVAAANGPTQEDEQGYERKASPSVSPSVMSPPLETKESAQGSFGTGTTMEARTTLTSSKDQQTPSASWNAGSSQSGSNNTATSGPQEIGTDFVRLRYFSEGSYSSASKTLNFFVGMRASIPAHVDIKSEKQGALEDNIQFAVDPSLPEGLLFNKSSGLISGVPRRVQSVPSEHNVTISIDATGPGGIPLGVVPLTSCTIVIRIVDLSWYVLSGLEEKIDREGVEELVIRLQKC